MFFIKNCGPNSRTTAVLSINTVLVNKHCFSHHRPYHCSHHRPYHCSHHHCNHHCTHRSSKGTGARARVNGDSRVHQAPFGFNMGPKIRVYSRIIDISRNGSVLSEKWSHRGIEVNFGQKSIRKVTHFSNISWKSWKNAILSVLTRVFLNSGPNSRTSGFLKTRKTRKSGVFSWFWGVQKVSKKWSFSEF